MNLCLWLCLLGIERKFIALCNGTANATTRTGMKFTLKQAADAVGKDRSTLQRAIKNGRLSASINDLGNYEIDAAELYRVFDAVARNSANATDIDATPVRVDALQQQVQMQREFIATLEKLLDEANADKRRLMQLLEHKPQKSDASELWRRIFRGKL